MDFKAKKILHFFEKNHKKFKFPFQNNITFYLNHIGIWSLQENYLEFCTKYREYFRKF